MIEGLDAVLVPYRPNGGPVGDRYRWLWDHVQPRLQQLAPVYTGEPAASAWSRSQAVNDAARRAGDWEVALIGDCDTIADEGSVRRAVAWVRDTGEAVRPHLERVMLNKPGTLEYLQRGTGRLNRRAHYDRQHQGGGLLVVTREAFEAVGGYDESYVGWGYEDTDMNLRLLRECGWERLPGIAWHLFHERVDNQPRPESRNRYRNMLRDHAKDITRWSHGRGLSNPSKVF